MRHRFAILVLAAASFLLPMVSGSSAAAAKEWITLEHCTLVPNESNDGDSFHIKTGETEYLIRLYLVDAPEIESVGAGRLVEQANYFGVSVPQVIEIGRRAKQLVDQELSQPFTVATHLAGGLGRSKVQRFYAFIRTKDGDLGELLIFNGLGRVHGTRAAPPGVASSAEEISRLQDLEKQAQEAKRGGWNIANMAQQSFQRLPQSPNAPASQSASAVNRGEAKASSADAPAKGKLTAASPKLNVNTATKEELERIPGVGATMAERIVADRPFKSADDLKKVKGVGGGKRYQEIRPYFQ